MSIEIFTPITKTRKKFDKSFDKDAVISLFTVLLIELKALQRLQSVWTTE